MAFLGLSELLPEVAENETRSIIFFENRIGFPPAGQYTFFELFCDELNCDCRNAMIFVYYAEEKRIVAQLRYFWKSRPIIKSWI